MGILTIRKVVIAMSEALKMKARSRMGDEEANGLIEGAAPDGIWAYGQSPAGGMMTCSYGS